MDLHNKKALVTGASGDLGGVIAKALANAGVDVAVSYVGDRQRAEKTVSIVKEIGRASFPIQLDLRDPVSINNTVERVITEFQGVDILINNAAWNIGIPFKNLDDLNGDVWDRVLETNLRGPFLLSRALAKYISANGNGRIVNIASVGGILPESSSIAYSASKAGLIHLTRCLAVALAPNVAVNCIAPGLIENTRIAKNLPDEIVRANLSQAVLGKVGSVEDIAAQVVLFCKADTITGQVMIVDGGVPARMR